MIRIEKLTKRFDGDVTALSEIDLEVRRGEFVFVTGSSGAGKSSLLRLLLRQDVPSSGRILIDGVDIGALPRSKVPRLRRAMATRCCSPPDRVGGKAFSRWLRPTLRRAS